jgi:uncharacterized membrane protein YqiK
LNVEKARIAQEQMVTERDIERTLNIETARIGQEQTVQLREIEKNLVVETSQIDQTRQVELAEIERTLKVELSRISQEQDIIQRDIEKVLQIEKARIGQEQIVIEREIEKNMAIELAQISLDKQVQLAEIEKALTVEKSRINQELVVTLADEDRRIAVFNKHKQTEIAEKDQLDAVAEKVGAEVKVTATERVKDAEWQKEVALINAESQAKPIERIADAILAEAKAKAQGEMAHLEARNVAEQRVLVQEALLSLIETSPQLFERLMKPVEKIQGIKILDMGIGDKQGIDKSTMGRVAASLLDTSALMPMLKELFSFADVDAEKIADKVAKYLSDLVKTQGGGGTT